MPRRLPKKIAEIILMIASFLVPLAACQAGDAGVQMLTPPTGENTSLSRLFATDNGAVHLSWVHSEEGLSTLYHAALIDGRWESPEQIAQGKGWFVNWADFPFLSVGDSGMAAHWLQKSGVGTYSYDVKARFLDDASGVWGDPVTVHKDGIVAEHGFVSMFPMRKGRTFISWLDGRNTVAAPGAAESKTTRGAMTLRAGIFDHQGKTIQEWELDSRTCDCCQTSAAMTKTGPIVVYRDRTKAEVRDIYITRLVNNEWTKPMPIYADGWVVPGCPVNGPSVASKNGLTAVVWFSAAEDKPSVKIALSHDGGASFGAPIMIANGDTNGRVSIAILESGNIAVSWLATKGTEAQLMLARYSALGRLLDNVEVAKTSASRRSGFPTIASVGGDVYVSWTELGEKPQIRVARVRFSDAQVAWAKNIE